MGGMNSEKIDLQPKAKIFRLLLLAAAIATLLLIFLGSVVRVTGTAKGCPDWPTCYNQFGLPAGVEAKIQYAHRAAAGLSGLLIGAAVLFALKRYRKVGWITIPLLIALVLTIIEVFMGGTQVLRGTSPGLNALHQALALAILAMMAAATTAAFFLASGSYDGEKLAFRSPFARVALLALAATFILMVNGTFVAASGAGQSCAGWPLCSGGLPADISGWVALGHRVLSALVSLSIVALFFSAWKSQRSQPVTLTAATAVGILFIGQILVGALKVSRGFPQDLVGLHSADTAALWASLVVLSVSVGIAQRSSADERIEARQPLPFRQRAHDFLVLSKPIIVALLLVTTYAGMVVGGHKIPSLALTLWTLLGGALAAGGSSAINQYIDRDLDKNMQRTAKRPLAAGRMMPAEGLAFGVGLCLAAFFVLAGFVNLLAAVLSLAGMVYYVLIYSVLLKKATVQNIVIGGGAGAIPPLVGWAAASGSLNIPSLFLFAIVFLWTPPHFWSLALVRQKDYARAGVPMLPVVRGERVTRIQIFIYTLELVALTLLMPVFKVTGSLYLVSAVVLGGLLLLSAWRVLRKGGNKTAWMMYRMSSMYLMLLFFAMVLDVLI